MSELDRPRSPRAAILPLSVTSSPRQKSKNETIRARSEVPVSSRTGTRVETTVKPQVSTPGGTMRKPVRAAAMNIPVITKLPSPQQSKTDLDLPLRSPRHAVAKPVVESVPREEFVKEVSPVQSKAKVKSKEISPVQSFALLEETSPVQSKAKVKSKEISPVQSFAPLEAKMVKETSPVQSKEKIKKTSVVREQSPVLAKEKIEEKSFAKEVSPRHAVASLETSIVKEKVKEVSPRHAVASLEAKKAKEVSPVQPKEKVEPTPPVRSKVKSVTKEVSPRHAVAPLTEKVKSVAKEHSDGKRKAEIKSPRSSSETAATVQVFSQSESKPVSRARYIVPPIPAKSKPSQKSKRSRLESEPKIISLGIDSHSQGLSPSATGGCSSKSTSCLQTEKSISEWETSTRRMKPKKRTSRKRSEQEILYEQYKVPKGSQLVRAGDRYYVVKKFDKMTPEEQQLERTELEMKILGINRTWSTQGIHFKLASPDESLLALSVRHQQYARFAKSRMGSDGYKIMLVLGWVATEGILCWLGIPAQGYVENQIALFDLYQNRLIEMGELGGFGQDWSPMTWILVMSAVNAAILIGINKFCDGKGAQIAMRSVAGMITGKEPALDVNGEALPPEQQTGPNPVGDILNNFMGGGAGAPANPMVSMIGKFLPQMFSNVTGGMQGRATAAKKPPRARKGPTHS